MKCRLIYFAWEFFFFSLLDKSFTGFLLYFITAFLVQTLKVSCASVYVQSFVSDIKKICRIYPCYLE